MNEWQDTEIWTSLTANPDEHAESVKAALELKMPDIERVLRAGGTALTAFTLHDADHSFRVAQRMAEIIPEYCLGSPASNSRCFSCRLICTTLA